MGDKEQYILNWRGKSPYAQNTGAEGQLQYPMSEEVANSINKVGKFPEGSKMNINPQTGEWEVVDNRGNVIPVLGKNKVLIDSRVAALKRQPQVPSQNAEIAAKKQGGQINYLNLYE